MRQAAHDRERSAPSVFATVDLRPPKVLILGADVHVQSTPAEVEQALGFVGDELRRDLKKVACDSGHNPPT